jgi:peptide deformylase
MATDQTLFLEKYELKGEFLKILTYPDSGLTKKSIDVQKFDDSLIELSKNMLFTMYHAPGIGLAAPQIGKNIRMFVIDIDYERNTVLRPNGEEEIEFGAFKPQVFINPQITSTEGSSIYQEGCLSLPEVYEEVERPEKISIEYYDLNGVKQVLHAEGILATCIQHEYDHLNGIVFIDHLGSIKKNLLKKKLTKKKTPKK